MVFCYLKKSNFYQFSDREYFSLSDAREQQRNAFFFSIAQSVAKVGSRDRQSTWETARRALACSIRSILPRSLKCRTRLRFRGRDCIPRRGRRRARNVARSHRPPPSVWNRRGDYARSYIYVVLSLMINPLFVSRCIFTWEHGSFAPPVSLRKSSRGSRQITDITIMNASCLRAACF